MNGQPSQFLQCIQYLAAPADQLGQILSPVDADDRTVALDIEIDVAVKVQDIEEFFEVVAGNLALGN